MSHLAALVLTLILAPLPSAPPDRNAIAQCSLVIQQTGWAPDVNVHCCLRAACSSGDGSPITPKVYDAMGDSITAGNGTTHPVTQSYDADVATALGYDLTNLGIDSETIIGGLTDEVSKADANANLITLDFGTNDETAFIIGTETIAQYRSALDEMLIRLKARAPKARILLLTPQDGSMLPPASIYYLPTLLSQYHAGYLEIVAALQATGYQVCTVEDAAYYSNVANFSSVDLAHPSTLGAQEIARAVEGCLKET